MANKRVLDLPTITSVLSSDYIVLDRPSGTSKSQLISVAAYIGSLPITVTVADNSITNIKMADNAISTLELSDKSVTTEKLADNAVTNAKLGTSSVKAANIEDAAITPVKLNSTIVNATGGLTLDTVNGLSVKTIIRPEYITNTVLSLADSNCIVPVNNASAITITVPADTTLNFPIGTNIVVYQKGAGQVTIDGAAGVTLLSNASKVKLTGQYSSVALFKLSTNTWLLGGDLTT